VPDSCSARTCEIGEPLAGTAGVERTLVAVAWPKPLWHADEASLSEGLPPDLRELEQREKRAGRKLALRLYQRVAGSSSERTEMLLFSPRESGDGCLRAVREIAPAQLRSQIERFVAGEQVGDPAPRTLLVCTDGKHDRCCAARGRPFHAALCEGVLRRGAAIEVAESSHLGGHRFAANCLALPEGRLYGRLGPEDAGPLLDALGRGLVLASRQRGRLGLAEPAQVAETWLLARFPGAREIAIGKPASAGSDGELRVELGWLLDGAVRRAALCLREREFSGPTSCGDAADFAPRLRWVATRAEV
jgi:hypothetical protein